MGAGRGRITRLGSGEPVNGVLCRFRLQGDVGDAAFGERVAGAGEYLWPVGERIDDEMRR